MGCCGGGNINFNSFGRSVVHIDRSKRSFQKVLPSQASNERKCPRCRNIIYSGVTLTNPRVFCPVCKQLVLLPLNSI